MRVLVILDVFLMLLRCRFRVNSEKVTVWTGVWGKPIKIGSTRIFFKNKGHLLLKEGIGLIIGFMGSYLATESPE